MKWAEERFAADPMDFAPPLLRIQQKPPPPLAGWVFRVIAALLVCVLVWAALGPLDIVAVADGKLVPTDYLKIVQPAEQGIVKAILVREGEQVSAGQVLIRMDPVMTGADLKSIQTEVHHKRLALRRIDSQLWREAQSRER
jgi:membrane fusion protein, hemolysin D